MDIFGCAVQFGCILSIGTGIGPNTVLGNPGITTIRSFVTGLLAISTSCENTHKEVERLSGGLQLPGADKYFRFNPGTWLPAKHNWAPLISIDDWKHMAAFGQLATTYMLEPKQSARVAICASLLNPTPAPTPPPPTPPTPPI